MSQKVKPPFRITCAPLRWKTSSKGPRAPGQRRVQAGQKMRWKSGVVMRKCVFNVLDESRIGAIEFVETQMPRLTSLISRSSRPECRGQWQITRLSDGEPRGHTCTRTLDEAVNKEVTLHGHRITRVLLRKR